MISSSPLPGKPNRRSLQPSASPAPRFKLQINGRTEEVSFQDAFLHGYDMIREGNLARAEKVFDALSSVSDRGPRARIMLARCYAQKMDFQRARTTLDETFATDPTLAAGLHEAFVFERFGMRKDAAQELVAIANAHRELPTVCLLLGDLFAADRKLDKAQQCWKLAVKRDRPDGAIALLGQRTLGRLSPGRSKSS